MAHDSWPRANILGVGVSAINMADALQAIDWWVTRREPHYVCVTPAHGIMECQRDPALRRVFNASGLTTPDGMAIVWLLRLLGHSKVGRVYGPDLLLATCELSLKRGYRHFFYGGAPGVAQDLSASLQKRFPGLQVAGHYTPPFRPLTPEEDGEVVAAIKAAAADIVWVGISTPKQELWMNAHVGHVTAPVLIGVGAAFDFVSGRKRQAPRWVQRCGFEWLFRLLSEPSRLWRRYIQYPWFVALLLAQALRLKRYPLE